MFWFCCNWASGKKKKIKRFYAEYITVIKLVYNGKHPPPQNSPALQEPPLTSPANDSAHYKVQKSLFFFSSGLTERET